LFESLSACGFRPFVLRPFPFLIIISCHFVEGAAINQQLDKLKAHPANPTKNQAQQPMHKNPFKMLC
jgi:hypothetical protein